VQGIKGGTRGDCLSFSLTLLVFRVFGAYLLNFVGEALIIIKLPPPSVILDYSLTLRWLWFPFLVVTDPYTKTLLSRIVLSKMVGSCITGVSPRSCIISCLQNIGWSLSCFSQFKGLSFSLGTTWCLSFYEVMRGELPSFRSIITLAVIYPLCNNLLGMPII
jgi:hypothetical protein